MASFPIRNLVRLMQKSSLRRSSTFPASVSSSSPVEYLVNSCGLSEETAILASRKLELDEKKLQRYKFVLDLFKSHGFTPIHLEKLIARYPRTFKSRDSENLSSKLHYLIDYGFSGSLLPQIIVSNPCIINRSLIGHLKPTIEFLEAYLGTHAKVVAAIRRCTWLLSSPLGGKMQANLHLLVSEGMHPERISKLIMSQPSCILQPVDRVARAVEAIKKMDLQPSDSMFVSALPVWLNMRKTTWKRKLEHYKSLGWSEEEIMLLFKHRPWCMAYSEDNIKSKVDFYVNSMKLEVSFVIACPQLLMYSLETRILPRYNILKLLESKGFVKDSKSLHWLRQTNEMFLKNYVSKHLDNIPDLVKLCHHIIPTGRKIGT